MDRVVVDSEKREVRVGEREDLKGKEKEFKEIEKESEKDIPYNESTRYYWF